MPELLPPFNISHFGATDIGLLREENDDSFFIHSERGLFAVADGVGGLPNGAIASAAAVQRIEDWLEQTDTQRGELNFPLLFEEVHDHIRKLGRSFESLSGIGTTLTVAQIVGRQLIVAHAGDSGILLLRKGSCWALTRNHTIAEDIRSRLTGADSAYIAGELEHTLSRCMGQGEDAFPDIERFDLEAGDRLLLYTDGVTDQCHPEEILKVSTASTTPRHMVEQLIKDANARGGHDNATAIAIYIEPA